MNTKKTTLSDFTPFSTVSVVDFEQVNVSCVVMLLARMCKSGIETESSHKKPIYVVFLEWS